MIAIRQWMISTVVVSLVLVAINGGGGAMPNDCGMGRLDSPPGHRKSASAISPYLLAQPFLGGLFQPEESDVSRVDQSFQMSNPRSTS